MNETGAEGGNADSNARIVSPCGQTLVLRLRLCNGNLILCTVHGWYGWKWNGWTEQIQREREIQAPMVLIANSTNPIQAVKR